VNNLIPETLKSLEEVATEGIFSRNAEKGIVYANQALVRMFGYESLEEFQSIPNHLLHADEEARKHLLSKLAANGFLQNHRELYRRKDNSNFWGSLTCRAVTRGGEVFYDGSLIDITQTILLESQLQEKKDGLAKLSLEMDRFMYSASHDIRSPVCTITGLLNLMKKEQDEESAKKLVEMMGVCVSRLEHFVNGLSMFAENSRKDVEETAISFNRVLSSVLERFHRHPSYSMVSINTEIKQECNFYSDPFRVRLILSNVLKNSFDYADLRKSERILSIQLVVHPDKSIIEVFDNGMGIKSIHLEKVFDMFYRGTNVSTGSGMGLYTTREAVIALGGIITLNSEYGIGTSVRIELPNAAKEKLELKKKSLKNHKKIFRENV